LPCEVDGGEAARKGCGVLAARPQYEWVLDGDIDACFDSIDHTALTGRVRRRVGDKRALALVTAFLRAGILSESGLFRNTSTGTPQGGILSPLLANIALSVLDDHFAEAWQTLSATSYRRVARRRKGLANYRLVRYADDFLVLVHGSARRPRRCRRR
jgi:RNA-directed DNA polymerase